MKKLLAYAKAAFNLLTDNRTKNLMLLILAVMSAFGMIAPEVATDLRDAVLAMAF